MTRTLQHGDRIDRYRIVGPLGAGGMGEVYRAHDETLERDVALKVLPQQLVRSPERVRRFILEAKSASSLNHPNIVTIYEIGEAAVGSAPGAVGDDAAALAGAPPIHYISMELVAGETLGEKIHEERVDLKTLLGWLAQAAEGVAKAHSAGIVHRDLKPGNIMVSHDGYAKVLDFGLAKLTERGSSDPALSTAPTEVGGQTTAGVLMGTVGYMSPEQVQAKPVDHRTDVFSFGCILYEAATRRRPFVAESSIETLHKILHDKPSPVEEVNPAVPTELRRLIRRCLAKSAEQRYQSMKDVAIELRDIVDEFDSLSASTSSASGASHAALGERPAAPSRSRIIPVVLALVIGIGGLALGLWGLNRGGTSQADTAGSNVRMSTLTSRGDVNEPVLSPDGRYLAYLAGAEAPNTIRVTQVATGSDVEVLGPQIPPPFGLAFSPDGNYLYYLGADTERSGYKALYQVPSLGGTPVKRLYDIDGAPSFAPDGRRIAFWRGVPSDGLAQILVYDLETNRESDLSTVHHPESITGVLAWSPDGRHVAAILTGADRARMEIALFRTSDGRRESFRSAAVPYLGGLSWRPDSKALYTTFLDTDGSPRSQLALVALDDGRFRRLTTGFDSFAGVSVAADGSAVATLRTISVENLWVVDADGGTPPRQLTHSSGGDNATFYPQPLPGGDIAFLRVREDGLHLWRSAADGSGARALTTGRGYVREYIAVGSRVVYQWTGDDLLPHIFALDLESGNAHPLSTGSGEVLLDVSPADGSILFFRRDTPGQLQAMGPNGENPRVILPKFERLAFFSPDGRKIAFSGLYDRGGVPVFGQGIMTLADSSIMESPSPAPYGEFAWVPNGREISAIDRADPNANLKVVPLDGGTPEALTRFTEGRLGRHHWSPDGRRVAVIQQTGRTANLLVIDRSTGQWKAVTNFPTGFVSDVRWSLDGRTILFIYGSRTSDAVLVRDLPS